MKDLNMPDTDTTVEDTLADTTGTAGTATPMTEEEIHAADVATAEADTTPKADPASDINAKLAAAGITSPVVFNVDAKYSFRADKDAEKAGVTSKRPTVTLTLPYPTVDGVINGLKDDKVRDLILEAVGNLVFEAARSQVNDESKPVNSQDQLDVSKLTLESIANQPKAERRGGGIPKEVWTDFMEDYIAIMPAVSGKDKDQCTRAAKLFHSKLQLCKTNKAVLAKLSPLLDTYFENTKQQEEFAPIYEFLVGKLTEFMNLSDEDLTANL